MSGRTFKVIVILVGLLFINIEVAQAGLIHKFKSFILHEFPDYQLFYIVVGLLSLSFLIYVILTPVVIGNEKSVWLDYSTNNPIRSNYQNKKELVRHISSILNSPADL